MSPSTPMHYFVRGESEIDAPRVRTWSVDLIHPEWLEWRFTKETKAKDKEILR